MRERTRPLLLVLLLALAGGGHAASDKADCASLGFTAPEGVLCTHCDALQGFLRGDKEGDDYEGGSLVSDCRRCCDSGAEGGDANAFVAAELRICK
jgi:hypothetical protein